MIGEFAALLKAVAWPAVALTALVLLRREAALVLTAIRAKVDRSTHAKFSAFGVRVDLAEKVARGGILRSSPTAGRAGETEHQEFERLVAEYEAITPTGTPDSARARWPIADRLGTLAATLQLPRGPLAAGGEGRIVALATAILIAPATSAADLKAVEAAARTARFHFTGYRLVLAVIALLSRMRPRTRMLDRAAAALADIERNTGAAGSASLQELLDATREAIESARDAGYR